MDPQAPTPPPTIEPGASPRFGAYPARIARDGDGLTYAVIPAPTYPTPANTLAQRKAAIGATFTGRWEEAVDLYRQTVEEDLFFTGILDTIAQGSLQIEPQFQGDPRMCSALLDADGTPGDYARQHPHEECGKIFRDGIGLGVGLGQYLLMCWRCGYTDHDRVESVQWPGRVYEVCRRCDSVRIDRPAGARELFQLQWRDPRWLWQNPVSFGWYYTARSGLIPIVDGDGEWLLFRTVPGLEPWRHGPWIGATLAAIFSRDAQYDAQNTSSVCAPTPVLKADKAASPDARREAERRLERLSFDNRFVLDGEWTYSIVSAKADFIDICEGIVNRCSDAFEVALTGNVVGRKPQAAFTDGKFTNRVTRERRGYFAGAWARQIGEKGLSWWARGNFGAQAVCPVMSIDVRSPEDKLAASNALAQEGAALQAIRKGADAVGVTLEPAWVLERLQRIGVRARPGAGPSLGLGPEQIAALVRGNVGALSIGLDPFPPGDPRGDKTIAEMLAAAKGGAAPATAHAPPPSSPAPTEARREEPAHDEDDEPEDEDAARLAGEMTAHGIDACEHGRRNRCPLCGVERVRGVVPGEHGAAHGWRLAWRATRRARFNPGQDRAQDGEFGAGGGSSVPAHAAASAKVDKLADGRGTIETGKIFDHTLKNSDSAYFEADGAKINEAMAHAQPETISLSGLTATQRSVNVGGVKQALAGHKSGAAEILEHGGKRYVLDGHHKLAAAILRGDTHAQAKVVRL